MLLFFIFLFVFSLLWGYSPTSGIYEFFIDRCGSVAAEGLLLFDMVSLNCLLMLLFCGSAALLFCGHYFGHGSINDLSLNRVLVIFLGVMGFLVSSYSMLGTLVMWEYLGVVSFFLILFYGNLDSLRATIITLFASRFGDVCLFGLVVIMTSFGGSTTWLFFCFVVLVVITKSACFPFISWLLEAMRAPTPVSSLVHSSTLVAAGVWFLFRYGSNVSFLSSGLEFFLCSLCLSTILVSSFCSLVFFDLKKIVALSTCNNVSWCVVFFLYGDICLGLFQLVSHGIAKCFLFIGLGDLMSSSSSAQDCRGVFSSSYGGFFSLCFQSVLILSLSGLPFLGIFFSKHALLSGFLWCYSPPCYIFLFLAFCLSCAYSFRFLFFLCGFKSIGVFSYGSLFIYIFLCSMLSGVLNFFCVGGSYELSVTPPASGVFLLLVQAVGCFLGFLLYYSSPSVSFIILSSLIWGCEGLVGVFYSSFSRCYSMFLFLLYRWEVFLGSFFLGLFSFDPPTPINGWRSLKFLVLSIFCLLFVYMIFF